MQANPSAIRNPQSTIALCLCASAVIFLLGCQPVKVEPVALQAPLPAITYAELAAKYNQRIALIDQFWTRATVTARWADDKDKWHFEQGDGPLIFRRPTDLALAIGKVGNTRFWLGCNPRNWWLLDLSGDPRVAYLGSMSQPLSADARRVLPVPLRPDQLIGLLGLSPLPVDVQPDVSIDGRVYRLTFPPQAALGNLHQTLYIDDQFRPTRIVLSDDHDQTLIDAKLASYLPIASAPQAQPSAVATSPTLASAIDLTLYHPTTFISLRLEDLIDARSTGQIKPVQFDFEKLARAYHIDVVRTLNPPTPAPGTAPGTGSESSVP